MYSKSISAFLFALFVIVAQVWAQGGKQAIKNPNEVRYGATYHLLNGYGNWNGGYLDAFGNASYHLNQWDVSTSSSYNRDNGTGIWKILSAEGKPEGSAVMHGDKIRLYNMYQNNGGYLDVCSKVSCEGENFGVMTSRPGDRDGANTSTWMIEAEGSGPIEMNEILHFRTLYNNHWLQTCGVQEGNKYDVNTNPTRERRELVTQWKMIKAQ